MYRSEDSFKQSLLKALRDRRCLCVCKESDWKMRDFLQKKSCIRTLTYHKCKGESK